MHRRNYLVASGALALASLPGMVATQETEGRTDGEAEAIACAGAVAQEDEPPLIAFDGSGAEVTDPFDLDGGVTIVEGTHDGGSNFIVELVAEEYGELVFNAIGGYEGATGGIYGEGEYRLDVTADGDWSVAIRQPADDEAEADAEPLPQSLVCDGPTWAGPYLFDGLAEAAASHEGESNFIVEILVHGATFPELVVNEIGSFDGETTFRATGVGYVVVDADGQWTLEMA